MMMTSISNDRPRPVRVPNLVLGRPVPSRWRHVVLDDALLGTAWRWDGEDDRHRSAAHPKAR